MVSFYTDKYKINRRNFCNICNNSRILKRVIPLRTIYMNTVLPDLLGSLFSNQKCNFRTSLFQTSTKISTYSTCTDNNNSHKNPSINIIRSIVPCIKAICLFYDLLILIIKKTTDVP